MTRRMLIACLAALAANAGADQALAAAFTDQFNSEWYTVVSAAQANNVGDVKTFIAKRVNLNTADPQGRTALSVAAQLGNLEIARLLIDAKASVDQRDKSGSAPLHWAAENGKIDVLKLLIAARAPIDSQDRQGITPLMVAVAHNQLAAVKALLAGGADPRKQDYTGRDAFGWASAQPAITRVLQDSAKP